MDPIARVTIDGIDGSVVLKGEGWTAEGTEAELLRPIVEHFNFLRGLFEYSPAMGDPAIAMAEWVFKQCFKEGEGAFARIEYGEPTPLPDGAIR